MGTNQLQNDEVEIDLKELFFALLHKVWIIILAAIVCAGAAGVWTKTMITPQFQSSSMLFILTKTTSITSLADIQMGTQLTKDYSVLIKSRPVLAEVIKNLGLNLTTDQLAGKISIGNPGDTRIVTITITDPNPEMSKEIADEMAEVSSKRIADIMKTDKPGIVEEGVVPKAASSPNTIKNCLLGGVAGGAAAVFIIILLFMLNDTIKTGEDVEKYLGLNTLGLIPDSEKKTTKKKKLRKR